MVGWCGNFAGCALFVGLMYSCQLYEGRDWYAIVLAQKKARPRAPPLPWEDPLPLVPGAARPSRAAGVLFSRPSLAPLP